MELNLLYIVNRIKMKEYLFKVFSSNLNLLQLIATTALAFLVIISSIQAQETRSQTKGARTLFLIRHGQYDHDDDRSSDIGKALVPLGIAQSK